MTSTSAGLVPAMSGEPAASIGVDDDARVTRLTTVQVDWLPNLVWVEIESDDGVVGLGETFFHGDVVAEFLHRTVAPYLVGQRAADISRHWISLHRQWGRSGIGAEARGASAVDIALWDAAARRLGIPLHDLLGGRARDSIRAYNTCAGPRYGRAVATPNERLSGIGDAAVFEDLSATRTDAGALAEDLLNMGIRAMKIWPFDVAAVETGGHHLTAGHVREGLRPFQQIRAAVGDDIAVALELHNLWGLPAAKQIAAAVEEYRPMWIEDPMPLDNADAVADFARSTSVPLVVSERLGDAAAYLPFLRNGAASIVMTDPVWVGGVSEARRVGDLAALWQRPFTVHDCTGPVALAVGVHLCLNAETATFQEMVRAYYFGWYAEVADNLPVLDDGHFTATGRGHGVTLSAAMRQQARVRTSGAGAAT